MENLKAVTNVTRAVACRLDIEKPRSLATLFSGIGAVGRTKQPPQVCVPGLRGRFDGPRGSNV